jgi:translocation and assembly module TamB
MKWRRILGWSAAILGIFLIVLLVGGYIALKTPWVHHYVLAKIIEEGQTATGGKLEVQNWDLHFRPLTADLYGIVLHGTEPPNTKPLLEADRLTVGVSARSLLHRKLQLTELLIQHPVVNVLVGSSGKNNFPTPPPKKSQSSTTVWDLAVGHTVLNNGDVYYNDKKSELNADLFDLRTKIRFDSSATRYAGTLSYRNGRLQYRSYSPLAHNLDADFNATPAGATLNSLLLTVGSSRIAIRGDMKNYNSPTVNAAYQILIHTQDFAAMSPGVKPSGDVHIDGDLRYQDIPNQPLLRTASLNGRIDSSDLQAASADGHLALRNLKAQYQLAGGDLQLHAVAADVVNGHLAADLDVQHLDGTQEGKLHAALQHLSLESCRQSMNRAEVKRMPATGTVDAAINGSWTGSVKNIRALADATLRAAVWNSSAKPKSATPVDGTVHVAYDGPRNIITLHQTVLRIPSTSVMVDGQLSSHSNLQVHAIAGDLHQLAVLASSLRTASSQPPSEPIALSGSATLNAAVQGPMLEPHIGGQFDAQNLQVQGSQWKSAHLVLNASPSQFAVHQGSLVSARQGNLSFSAQVGLKNWSYLPSSPITASLSARRMSLVELVHLANLQYPISGNLSADISFQGSQFQPAGHGSIQIVNASAYNQPIQNLTAQFQAANDTINSQLSLNLPAGSATANVVFTPKTKAYKVNLQAPGIVLQKLQAVQAKNLPLTGTLSASASGAGTIQNPQLDLTLEIPTLQVRQTAITGMKAQVNVQNQRANLDVSSNVTQAFVRAKATVDLAGNYYAQANFDTGKVPLDPLLAVYAPSVPPGFHGETELHASVKGPLKDTSRLEAHITIPALNGSYQSLQFGNAGPIRADYANSVLVLPPAEIRGTDTSLRFQGRVPTQGAAPMKVEAQGNVNLRLLSMFSPDIKSAGTVDLNVNGGGTIHNPAVQGTIQIKDGAFSTSDAPLGLSKLNGTLDITKDRLQITNLNGQIGGGQISAGGSVAFSPRIVFNVALQGKSIRLLYPDGVRTVLDSNLTFTGNMQAANLNGRTLIDSLNFTPDFDLSGFASQFNGTSVPPSGQSFADNIKLGISVQSAQNISARSTELSLEGAANLQVIGTASNPVIVGRVDLTGGELFFMSNRYQLQRGIVTFDSPNVTTPVLNVQVTTTVEQYNLTLTLLGPIDRLTTNYVSDPALPTADIISLLYRGQTTAQAAAAGTSTDSFLAGQAASKVSSSIQKLAGISSLQIDPLIGGNNTNPSARIALQQRVTKNLLFTFSTDVTQPGQEIVQGEYQVTKRWSVSVERDQVGGVAVDGRYHTKF